jgi:plasmid stability protein
MADNRRVRDIVDDQSAEAKHQGTPGQMLASEPEHAFDDLAAEFRALTAGRRHTPTEALLKEGREER